jgi:hypothetical protein
MSTRLYAARVLAKRKIFETFIQPGYYIVLSISFLACYFFIDHFIGAVDSSGFSIQLDPLYATVGKTLQAALGETMLQKLFMEGPFLVVLFVFLIPMLIFLSFTSVFKHGLDKKVGAVELISYGPADGTSYFLAVFFKDILLGFLSIIAILIFAFIGAQVNNLVLGQQFLFSLITAFFVAAAVFSYGIVASAVTENGGSAVILFFAIIVFFLALTLGSLSIAGGYVQNLFRTLSLIIQWISPFYYWGLALRAVETGSAGMYLLSTVLLIALSGILLWASHYIVRSKGVRS